MIKMSLRGSLISGAIVVLAVVIAVGWWFYFRPPPSVGFVAGNGRLEATEIDIATKFHGRIAEVLVHEGDTAKAGQTVARMDTKSLEAQLREAEARVNQADKERRFASAVVRQRDVECALQPLAHAGRLHVRYKATPLVVQLIYRLPLHFLSLGHSF